MYRECRSLQLPVLVDMLLLSLFLSSHVGGTGAERKLYIAANCWLFNHQVLCTVCWFRHFAKHTMLLHSLPARYRSVYLASKHQPPQHIVHSLSNSQQWHSHTRKSVIMVLACSRDIHKKPCAFCGSLLLFKTERALSAIQQTCFCQLWVISLCCR